MNHLPKPIRYLILVLIIILLVIPAFVAALVRG